MTYRNRIISLWRVAVTYTSRIHRSANDRMLTGVSGGLAEYFSVDSVLVRLGWVVLCFITLGLAVLFYVVLAIVMPQEQTGITAGLSDITPDSSGDVPDSADEERSGDSGRSSRRRDLFAVALIVVGVLVLLANFGIFWWLRWDVLWPLVLIGIGAAVLIGRARRV